LNFSTDYISARRVCWPLKFLHALQIDQGLLAHPRAASRWAVPHISSILCSSLATRLRCAGIFSYYFIANFFLNVARRNVENRSIFGGNMDKSVVGQKDISPSF